MERRGALRLSDLLQNPLALPREVFTLGHELLLNIRTVPPVPQNGNGEAAHSLFSDNEEYSTINYWFVRRIIRMARPSSQDVFYDLGCGMGRMLCMFGRRQLKKCVGVEFSPFYSELCQKNVECLRGRKSPVEVRCEDAALTDLSDGTIYYLFNPFGPLTMTRVIVNIESSLVSRPRKVTLIYANPVHRNLLDSARWEFRNVYRTLFGLDVMFWRNRDAGSLRA
jgi:hypothetical protein